MPLCRLSIQTNGDGASTTVDVALPAATSVGTLLPTVVALVGQHSPVATDATRWRLDRSCGSPIDETMTLAENDVRDGDLLVLTHEAAGRPEHLHWDPCRTVSVAALGDATPFVAEAICTWSVLIGAVVLAWTGVFTDRVAHLVVAACAATAVAVAAPRRPALRIAAVTMFAVTGFLAVPSGPAAANVFLAAVSACSAAVLLTWWAAHVSVSLIATTAFSFVVAASMILPTVVSVSLVTDGAVVVIVALGLLAVAPRLAVVASGLAPGQHLDDVASRATRGHTVLSGLVVGCAGAIALGCVVVAVACHRGVTDPTRGAAFATVVGLALLLRVRTHVDLERRAALAAGGLVAGSTALAIVAQASPTLAPWWIAAIIGVGLAAVRRREVGAVTVRAVDVIECVALATVIPLACWMIGVYTVARGWNPS